MDFDPNEFFDDDQDEPQTQPPHRATWTTLDTDQAHVVLARLRAWMGEVLVHEPTAAELLRPCWYRHPAVVQTLLDVQAAWQRAYHSDLDEAVALSWALEWSQRHLPHLEQRLSRLLAQCTSVRHDPRTVDLPRPHEADVRAYLRWWTSDRDPATEPPQERA
ncbi:hypothetical protein HNR06_004879 [Nocardiopsis arvandica]|uniref:DUF4913 domain-containing protein n=1 Tax=Nocardiopsis sinuspersici TaxID=501010 RepID=A0A7Z0BMH3_9ACTN|nr:DUF4913 domain-containing protein [Nocardiopsis sinuspersici]NYH55290.1 hypothetical protein [Nocardiopsis sinuspersici]